MQKTYRWGILGPGKIAAKFATALNYVDGAEVFAVASRDERRSRDFAQNFGAVRVYTSYEELAKDPDIDIIYIATPHAYHYEHVLLCLQHRKPVVCEKPFALHHSQVEKMIAVARKENVFLLEGMWTSFMPFLQKIKSIITEGLIGELRFLKADFGFNLPFDGNSRLYDISLGGGSLLDVGIYPLFLATKLLGEPSAVKSFGKLASTGADEYCNAILQYKSGATANIFSAITTQTGITAEITGSKGRIEIHNPWFKATDFTLHIDGGESQRFSFPHESNGFEHEIKEVMESLDKGLKECPSMPLDFSLMLSKLIDQVKEEIGVVYKV